MPRHVAMVSRLAILIVVVVACGESAPPPPPPPEVVVRVVGLDPLGAAPLACKVTVDRLDGPDPAWTGGTGMEAHVGVWRDDGTLLEGRTALATECDLGVPLSPGDYSLTVSSGIEREAVVRELSVREGEPPTVEVELAHTVDSTGWACGDLHVHSAPSVDSDVPLDQRLVAAVVEGLDVMAPTDHDAMGEWEPVLVSSGLVGRLVVLPGDEISPNLDRVSEDKGHFNVLGVPDGASVPDDFPHMGLTVEQIFANVRASAPEALLQISHPRSAPFYGYFSIIAFDPITGTGTAGMLAMDFDLLEVWNGYWAGNGPDAVPVETILDDFHALLRAGLPVVATGASDTHQLARSPVGMPRTCVRVGDDDPMTLTTGAYVDGLRAGDAFVTSGPFVDFTAEGEGLGATVAPGADGLVDVAVHVQAPAWVPVDSVRVLVDGEEAAMMVVTELPATVPFAIAASSGAFLTAIVESDTPLGVPAGQPIAPTRSLAFTNPIWVE